MKSLLCTWVWLKQARNALGPRRAKRMAEKEAELSSLRAENERLEEEMESLRSQLDEARQNASLSAECGLKLMELNQDLEQRLEQTASEYTEQIQVSGLLG